MTSVDLFVPVDEYDEVETPLARLAERALGWPAGSVGNLRVLRRSLDARKRRPLGFRILCEVARDSTDWEPADPPRRSAVPWPGGRPKPRVVVVGSGPAGSWAALRLSEAGVPVTIVERGKPVQPRRADLAQLTRGRLDPESNYCFGEGGAGTYSDGKLYTRSKDRSAVAGILADLVRFGSPARHRRGRPSARGLQPVAPGPHGVARAPGVKRRHLPIRHGSHRPSPGSGPRSRGVAERRRRNRGGRDRSRRGPLSEIRLRMGASFGNRPRAQDNRGRRAGRTPAGVDRRDSIWERRWASQTACRLLRADVAGRGPRRLQLLYVPRWLDRARGHRIGRSRGQWDESVQTRFSLRELRFCRHGRDRGILGRSPTDRWPAWRFSARSSGRRFESGVGVFGHPRSGWRIFWPNARASRCRRRVTVPA